MVSKNWNIDGYEKLEYAVIVQAVRDYKSALKRLCRHPDDIMANRTRVDCEAFFSDEISYYSELDGQAIMSAIRKQILTGE